jgi:hypothetical protein
MKLFVFYIPYHKSYWFQIKQCMLIANFIYFKGYFVGNKWMTDVYHPSALNKALLLVAFWSLKFKDRFVGLFFGFIQIYGFKP